MKKLILTLLIFTFILGSFNLSYAYDDTDFGLELPTEYPTGLNMAHPLDKEGNFQPLTEPAMLIGLEEYPSYFSLVDEGKSTSIENQGISSNCWVFAAAASMESNLLMENIVGTPSAIDISESMITWAACRNNDNDINNGDGENYDMPYKVGADWEEYVAAVLRGSCELEENAPFYPYELANMYYGDSDFDKSSYYHLKSAEFIPNNRDLMKERLTSTGALYIAAYVNNGVFNTANNSYYETSGKVANHSVTVVGWDDNYPKENFSTVPEGNGAWIVKNSWDTSWGDNGYFMMSYYQDIQEVVSFKCDTIDSYDNSYMYDGAGYYKDLKYSPDNSSECSYANIYTAENDEALTSVGIYALDNSLEYVIDIYKNPANSPDSGVKIYSQEGFNTYLGYYTIDLDNEIPLEKGDVFSVVVTQRSGSAAYIPCEIISENGKSHTYSVKPGQSYIRINGEYTDTAEITDAVIPGNVCIKAFTKYNNTDNMLSDSLNTLENTVLEYSGIEKGDYTAHSYSRLQRGIEKAKNYMASNPTSYKITNNYTYMLKGYYASLQKPIYITNASEFSAYAKSFNNATIKTTEAELKADIELTSNTPSAGNYYRFYGSFKGNNHKITNITKPLFYYGLNAEISGIRGEGNISVSSNTAGIAYYLLDNCSIDRCSFSGSITSTGTDSICGGIVVRADNSTVSDCCNKSEISAANAAGIIALALNTDVKNCYDSAGGKIAYGQNNSNYINCYSASDADAWAETITEDDLKSYSFAHNLNTTNNSELNSGIWSSNGIEPVFADSENQPIYSVKLNSDNTIYRKADEDSILPVNPVYNDRVVLNWLYDGNIVKNINNIFEDIILECDDAVLGDVDENDILNNNDAAYILKLSSDIELPTDRQIIIADCNGDNTIDLTDVVNVLKKLSVKSE